MGMTLETEWRYDTARYDARSSSRNAFPQRLLAGASLGSVALLCVWAACANHGGSIADEFESAGARGDKLAIAAPSAPASSRSSSLASAAPNPDDVKFDSRPLFDSHPLIDSLRRFESRYAWDFLPEMFSPGASSQSGQSIITASAPDQSTVQETRPVASAVSRPDQSAQNAPPLRVAPDRSASSRLSGSEGRVAANRPSDRPSIFEKLFGKVAPLTLAYAAPDDSFVGEAQNIAGRYDRWTAVYDISAHRVYLPDGTALEAHSGYGNLLDDPRHADAKDRGVTPPDVYDLEPREALFHGVRALRLIPVDDSKVFGRSGLLAHSFMLGPNGDSNGCVSFRNYDTFLQAYENHQIKRLVVVARLE